MAAGRGERGGGEGGGQSFSNVSNAWRANGNGRRLLLQRRDPSIVGLFYLVEDKSRVFSLSVRLNRSPLECVAFLIVTASLTKFCSIREESETHSSYILDSR